MIKDDILKEILDNNTEDEIRERIDEGMMDYLDAEDVENDYDGDVYEAYSELGRGESEFTVLADLLRPYQKHINSDIYCDVWEALCEEWSISTN